MIVPSSNAPSMCVILAFNESNQLAVRKAGTKLGQAFVGGDEAMATGRLEACFKLHTQSKEYFSITVSGVPYRILFTQVSDAPADHEVEFHTLEQLELIQASLAPLLVAVLNGL